MVFFFISCSQLVDEIVKYDAKTKELSTEGDTNKKVKDYRKTSMYKGVLIFEEFLRNLEKSNKSSDMDNGKLI